MNRTPRLATCFLIMGLAACVTDTPGSFAADDIGSRQAESYNGPKARIAVSEFEDKTSSSGQFRAEYGRGMSDMLTTALFQTNRYIVLEREKLQAVLAEQNLGASGRMKKETAAAIGEIEGAELMITAAITGFDPGTSGGEGTLGNIFGKKSDIIAGITGGFKRAHVAMDLRVIDTRTGRILSATNVDGSATSLSAGGTGSKAALSGALGGFSKTPLEAAIREMIGKAVDFIVEKTPPTYYHYSAGGEPIGGARPSAVSAGPDRAQPAPVTIRSDFDKDLVAQLTEVTLRGAVLSVIVTLNFVGETQSEELTIKRDSSSVMDYETGQTYPLMALDGFDSGRVKPGEVKKFHATFKAPKESKAIGITLSGIGTFNDVKLGR